MSLTELVPAPEVINCWTAIRELPDGLAIRAAESEQANREHYSGIDSLWEISWTKDGKGGLRASNRNPETIDAIAVLVPEFVSRLQTPGYKQLTYLIHLTNIAQTRINEFTKDRPASIGWVRDHTDGSSITTMVIASTRDRLRTDPDFSFEILTPERRTYSTNHQPNDLRRVRELTVMGKKVPLNDEQALAHALHFARTLKHQVETARYLPQVALEEADRIIGVPSYRIASAQKLLSAPEAPRPTAKLFDLGAHRARRAAEASKA